MPLNNGYSTGIWTPVLTFQTPGNLAVTYLSQVGRWARVGNMVTLWFRVHTSAFTHTTASGNLLITGCPFTTSNLQADRYVGLLSWMGITKANYTQIAHSMINNSSSIDFLGSGSGQTNSNIAFGDVPSGGTVHLRGPIQIMVD
jgi:hypothetical protein